MQSVVTAIPSQRGPSSFSQADQQVEFVREIDLNARSKKVFLSITSADRFLVHAASAATKHAGLLTLGS